MGGLRPSVCHSRQPSTSHARIPGHSALSFSARSPSRSSGGMVTANGMRWNRRRMASSTDRSDGLWLPAMISLNAGRYSKKSCRMKRAATVSPPVSCLIRALGPATAFFGFGRGDEAGAAEAGEIGRMTIGVARREGLDRRGLVIVAEDAPRPLTAERSCRSRRSHSRRTEHARVSGRSAHSRARVGGRRRARHRRR